MIYKMQEGHLKVTSYSKCVSVECTNKFLVQDIVTLIPWEICETSNNVETIPTKICISVDQCNKAFW